jgi:hypothetical protein
MTAGVGPVSGTKFYIGPAGAAPTSPDLWIEIGDISNLGDISQEFAQIAVESLGSGDTYQLKGNRSFPNVDLTMNRTTPMRARLRSRLRPLRCAARCIPSASLKRTAARRTAGTAIWQGEVFGFGPSYGGVSALRSVKTSVSIRPSTMTITLGV